MRGRRSRLLPWYFAHILTPAPRRRCNCREYRSSSTAITSFSRLPRVVSAAQHPRLPDLDLWLKWATFAAMNRFALILVALIGLVAATSCGRTDPALARADAVMEQAPDSALAILEAVDSSALRSDRSRALYGLLLTQARVKCDVPVASDSLIAASARYFADHGPDSLTMRSFFYKGWVLNQLGHHMEAMNPTLHAESLSRQANNYYWMAKSCELLADIYDCSYYYKEAATYYKKASVYYLKAGKHENHLYSLCDTGFEYGKLGDISHGISLLDSVKNIAYECNVKNLLFNSLSYTFTLYFETQDYASASKTYFEMKDVDDNSEIPFSDESAKALIDIETGDFSTADSLLSCKTTRELNVLDRIAFYILAERTFLKKGNKDLSYAYKDSSMALQDSIVSTIILNSTISRHRDFSTEQAHAEHKKYSEFRARVIIYSITAAIFVALLILLIHKSRRAAIDSKISEILKLSKEIEAQKNLNASLSSNLTDANETVSRLQQRVDHQGRDIADLNRNLTQNRLISTGLSHDLEAMFRESLMTINNICDQYIQTDDSKANQSCLIRAIEKEIAKLKDKGRMIKMEHDINRYMNDIMTRLRNECSFLKEEEFTFICFVLAGLSPRAVCLITGLKLKSFYSKKSRLVKRIENAGCDVASEIAARLS